MILQYSAYRSLYYIRTQDMDFNSVPDVQRAGFYYEDRAGAWVTGDVFKAASLYINSSQTNKKKGDDPITILERIEENLNRSRAVAHTPAQPLNAPEGLEYMPFQNAGIHNISQHFLSGSETVMLCDPMGLGKTVQACGVINTLEISPFRVLVICPASLRINWQREMDKWLIDDSEARPILKGEDTPERSGALIISYNLTINPNWKTFLRTQQWDLIIMDEAHYLKNPEAKRTAACLSLPAKHKLLLTGTPIPNNAHEFHPFLSHFAPHCLGQYQSEQAFQNRYTTGFMGNFGYQVTGGQNHEELSLRLRGSGFMTRRDKRTVLPQLPPERHQLVVFPQNSATAEIIKKEQENTSFDAHEILDAGKPLGYGSMPELRREMGIEKVADSVNWIKRSLLESGTEKVVIFAYHEDVLLGLNEGLKKYKPGLVYGKTPMTLRQYYVDEFMSNPECRVIMGGWEPLGVGWTLTASADVVFVEASYVPKDNEQAKDRLIRIGQTAKGVNVYYLVVEGSLDATILGKAASKANDINKVLN